MRSCIQNVEEKKCSNVQLIFSKSRDNYFWGCKLFPQCNYARRSVFDPNNLTENQNKLMNAFYCFVNLNSFLMVTFGTVYFNLKEAALLDHMLKSEIIRDNKSELETGETGARVFYEIYYHLMLLPSDQIRSYLENNFPENFNKFKSGIKANCFNDVDYLNNKVNEDAFLPYKDAYLNY
jgi:hypothetical protein